MNAPHDPFATVKPNTIVIPTAKLIRDLRQSLQPFELSDNEFIDFIEQVIDRLNDNWDVSNSGPLLDRFYLLDPDVKHDVKEFVNIFNWFKANLASMLLHLSNKYSNLSNDGANCRFKEIYAGNLVLEIFQ